MIDLREHLHELAAAGARHGATAGPAAAIRRGRRRRRRLAGAVGRLVDRPTLPATAPETNLPPLPRLDIGTRLSGSRSPEAVAFRALAADVRRCPGGYTEPALVGYYRSDEYRRLAMVVAKKPALGETTICWAAGVFDLAGGGGLPGPVQPGSTDGALTATVGASGGYGSATGRRPSTCRCSSPGAATWSISTSASSRPAGCPSR